MADEEQFEGWVFSGEDLLISHYDVADLDWREVAERTAMEELRGRVVAQVTILDDLLDELVLYLMDPRALEVFERHLLRGSLGSKVRMLRVLLADAGLEQEGASTLKDVDDVIEKRNVLAHSPLIARRQPVPIKDLSTNGIPPIEWGVRRLGRQGVQVEVVSEESLTDNLHEAIGVFGAMLRLAEVIVDRAPEPLHFRGGVYIGTPATAG